MSAAAGEGLSVDLLRERARESKAASAMGLFAALWILLSLVSFAGVGGVVPPLQELAFVGAVYAGLVFVVRLLWTNAENDALLILGVMLAIYVVFSLASVLFLGLDVNGLVNTLRRLTFLAAVYAMLVLALNLHWGYTGLFNIGVAGFMAVGVYTMSMLAGPVDPGPAGVPGLGLPLPIAIIGGVVAAGLVGFVAALPALRLDADYLAIVTVAFSEIIRLGFNSTVFQSSIPAFRFGGVELLPSIPVGTGGGQGITTPTNPIRALFYQDPTDTSAGLTGFGEFAFGAAESFSLPMVGGQGMQQSVVIGLAYVVVLVVFVAAFYWLLVRIGNSPFGRVLKAIREDELVANSLGKNTQLFKIKTFMVGCALMGLAGILWRGSTGFTQPGDYLPIQTFYVFLALIIGGAGSNTGSVVGGIVFGTLLFEGPPTVARVVPPILNDLFGVDLSSAPPDFVSAIAPLSSLDLTPLLAYSLRNISTLRFIFLGALVVYVMQNRPDGLLGHRKEVAASVDLSRTDGGEDE